MAPSGSAKNSSRRLKALRRYYSGPNNRTKVKSMKRRVQHDIIEGIDIYSFSNELELEYFSNIEEPLPRKMKRFRGFDETDDSVNLRKNHFDRYIKNFIGNPHTSKAVRPMEDGLERVGDPHAVPADEQVSTIILVSDDENSLNTTDNVPVVNTREPNDDTSVQIVNEPVEVITIDDSDSDDDVVMTSDPKASLPQPVRDCVCLNCGKIKRTEPREKRKIASESDRDSGLDDVSIITDEVITIMEEAVLVHSEEVTVDPEQTPTHPRAMPKAPTRPEGATVHPEDVRMSTQPEGLTVQPKHMPMSSHSRGKRANLRDVKPEGSTVQPDDVPITTQFEGSTVQPEDLTIRTQSKGTIVQPDDGPIPILPIGAPVKIEYGSMSTLPTAVPVELEEVSTHPEDVLFQPNDVPSQPTKVSMQPEEQSASRIGEPIGSTAGDGSLLEPHGVSSLTDQPGSPSSFSPHISPKRQKPSSSLNKMSAIAPGTIRVVLPVTGKTVILKFDGAKSTKPPRTPLNQTYQVVIPPDKIHHISVPPGPDENRVTRTQPVNEALGRFQVSNSCDAKSRMKQQTAKSVVARGEISHVESLKESHSASDLGKVTSSLLDKVNDSALVMLPTSDVVSSVGSPGIPEPLSSKLLVVDHAARSVVQDLVDFVCRKECFPASYPYDQMRTEVPCLTVPCRELRCRMGCICVSLAKKNVRRVRCKNATCIFGCICSFYGVASPANRHAKTRPNVKKVLGISRGKKVLSVLSGSGTESSGFDSTSQPPSYRFLLPMKVLGSQRACGVAGSSGSKESSHGSHPLLDSNSIRLESGFGHKDLQFPPKGLCFQKHFGNTASQASRRNSVKGLTVSVTQPRRFFGREKIPIPERALMCLTPGLGYVPLEEISPKVIIHNPFEPGTTKSFLHIRLATEWLNLNIQAVLNTTTDLRWVVADKSTIEKKQLHRLSMNVLNSLNRTIFGTEANSSTRKSTK